MGTRLRIPPIREIAFIRKRDPPLHRWKADNDGDIDDVNSIITGSSTDEDEVLLMNRHRNSIKSDASPRQPPKRSRTFGSEELGELEAKAVRAKTMAPQKPKRRGSNEETQEELPPFLSPKFAGGPPRRERKLPKKSAGFRVDSEDCVDIPNISLKPVSFIEKTTSASEDDRTAGEASELTPVRRSVSEGLSCVLKSVVMAPNHQKDASCNKDVTVLFAIRRPGCGNCREHGVALSELVEDMPDVNMMGVIKETGVDDKALHEFYADYFTFPLYKDERWDLFVHACGNRKLSVWKLIAKVPQLTLRYAKKNIRNIPFGGDLFTRGGVLIFDKMGKLRFVYNEKYGDEFDLEALRWAIEESRKPAPGSDTTPKMPIRCYNAMHGNAE